MKSNRTVNIDDVIEKLPPLPFVINKLLEEINDEKSNASRLADIISQDQTLTARVLRLVNSAFYGFQKRISTISHAVIILGFNSIKSLALGLSIVKYFSESKISNANLVLFWEHNIGTAITSKYIMAQRNSSNSEEAFVGGLLHDIGKLILLLNFGNLYLPFVLNSFDISVDILGIENMRFGTDHCKVGKTLVEKWQLPDSLRDMIFFSHDPEIIENHREKEIFQSACAIYISNVLTKIYLDNKYILSFDDPQFHRIRGYLNVKDEELLNIYRSIKKDIAEVKNFLGI